MIDSRMQCKKRMLASVALSYVLLGCIKLPKIALSCTKLCQVREFLNDNESSDEEITWGRNDEEDEAQGYLEKQGQEVM